MTEVCICEILCICVCIVQPERDTLEEKPFILPTDSPVSALTARIILIGFLGQFPLTKSDHTGV